MIHEAYWGHVFAKSTTLPDNVWDKAYVPRSGKLERPDQQA